MRHVAVMLALMLSASAAFAQKDDEQVPPPNFGWRSGDAKVKLLKEGGGNTLSEEAVAKGLAWLASEQAKDGSWNFDRGTKQPVASTAMGVLPLLGAGHGAKGRATKYSANVRSATRFLVDHQKATGGFGELMYHHALATMALCEAYGLSGDAKTKRAAQLGLEFIVKAQHAGGGWRYAPGQAGDTSVTGWQVQALYAGKSAGLKVPATTLTRAHVFLDSVSGDKGLTYGYTAGAGGSPSMIASGLLSRQLLGWKPEREEVAGGVEKLGLANLEPKDAWDSYQLFFVTHCVFRAGGKAWEGWNEKSRDFLVKKQEAGGGFPPDSSLVGGGAGRLATTSLALLTLEVYYRYPRSK